MSTIEIFELRNTWGCAWRDQPGGKTHYGFDELPGAARLWLSCASGDAVRQIIAAGMGEVIATVPGAYGGKCRTVAVNIDELEAACRTHWDRANARDRRRQEASNACHYCGQRATSIGFFEEPVCAECGG